MYGKTKFAALLVAASLAFGGLALAETTVPDASLRQTLAKKLAYDRVGYGNVFDMLTINVVNGVATVGGEVHTPAAKDSALDAVKHTKGVKGVIDNVKVAPASFFDDDLRLRTARAIYGDSVLGHYAMDPQAPIRIVVDNGHVALYGVVENQMDRTLAGIRANQVAGAFSVENHLLTEKDAVR